MTQIQCYKNSNIDIDSFVFHQGMTQWYHALILRALKRVLKKGYGIEFHLLDMFNKINPANNTLKPKLLEMNMKALHMGAECVTER